MTASASTKPKSTELFATSYELFILLLAILSIFNLVVIFLPGVEEDAKIVTGIIDLLLCIIFFIDFLRRLFRSQSKSNYFFRRWGWADLVSSLPFPAFKIFRLFRIFRVIRLMRKFGVKNMISEVMNNRAESALYITVFLVILVLEFGSMFMLFAERTSPDANITSASDAVWYTYVTITTVGYGDRYPVTNFGRIIGIGIMTVGVGLFGVLTGFLANAFLSPQKKKAIENADANDPKVRLAHIRELIAAEEQAISDMKDELGDLEKLL
jgi:voltage-gated potassium channel